MFGFGSGLGTVGFWLFPPRFWVFEYVPDFITRPGGIWFHHPFNSYNVVVITYNLPRWSKITLLTDGDAGIY